MLSETNKTLKNIFWILFFFFIVLVLYITHIMANFLVPIFLAFFVAMLFHPILRKLSKTKIPLVISTIIVILLSVLSVALVSFFIIISIQNFLKDISEVRDKVIKMTVSFINIVSQNELLKEYINKESILSEIKIFFQELNYSTYMFSTVNKTFGWIKDLFIFLIALTFIVPTLNVTSSKIAAAFPKRKYTIKKLLLRINQKIQNYIVVKSIISFVTGILTYIICIAFGVKHALLCGVLAFLLNYIPYIGSAIAVIIPGIFSILYNDSTIAVLFLVGLLIVMQQLLGSFLEPQFQSSVVGLSPIVILVSVMVWGFIWGIVGVILAVPIMSSFSLICENIDGLKPISKMLS